MQMDEVTQQNAALVEEAAAASQAMVEQAMLLEFAGFALPGQGCCRGRAPRTARRAQARE